MNTNSKTFRVPETICEELLVRLKPLTSPEARALEARTSELTTKLDGWRHELPTSEDRASLLTRVLDLHRAVMEFLTHVEQASASPAPRSMSGNER